MARTKCIISTLMMATLFTLCISYYCSLKTGVMSAGFHAGQVQEWKKEISGLLERDWV